MKRPNEIFEDIFIGEMNFLQDKNNIILTSVASYLGGYQDESEN